MKNDDKQAVRLVSSQSDNVLVSGPTGEPTTHVPHCNGDMLNRSESSCSSANEPEDTSADAKYQVQVSNHCDTSPVYSELPPIVIDSEVLLPRSADKPRLQTIRRPASEYSIKSLSSLVSKNNAADRMSRKVLQSQALLAESLMQSNQMNANSDGSSVSLTSKQSVASNESAVLTPILTEHARTRNYIVGSISHQHSLIGHQELLRYFPNRVANIAVITWNMCGKPADSGQLNKLILPERWVNLPDVYAVGVQEGPFLSGSGSQADQRTWELQLQTTIGPSHVMLHSACYGVLHLSVFVRRDLIWFCSLPEHSSVGSKSSAANLIKTKGALAICFKLFGSSILLVNCHFPAHERRNPQRIQEYKRICSQLALPRNCGPLPVKYASDDVTERFDYVFWFGDLNFRVEREQQDIIKLLTQLTLIANPNLNGLLLNDQLIKAIQKGEIFQGFQEADVIRFLPTYKYVIGCNRFDDVSKRVPSWTDRILYRIKSGHTQVDCKLYDSVNSLDTSDHKPVLALFAINLKPGRDSDAPLNAGLFNRDIYVSGLQKRRQLWTQISENKRPNSITSRKSNVCNIN